MITNSCLLLARGALLVFLAYLWSPGVALGQDPGSAPKPEGPAEGYGLEELWRLALARAERLKISEENLAIAKHGQDKVRAALLPRISAFGNYTQYSSTKTADSGEVSQPGDASSWGMRLDQTISLGGQELIDLEISRVAIRQSRHDLASAKEGYLLEVAAAYYDLLKAAKALEIADANVERLAGYRDAAQLRLKVGGVAKTAVLRAEAELSGALAERIRAENARKLAKAILARLTGLESDFEVREPETRPMPSQDNPTSKSESLATLKQTALAERAELKGLALQLDILRRQLEAARGAAWPTLAIEGVYARMREDPAAPTMNKESIYGGLKLTVPLYEGGRRVAERREAEAKLRQATLVYQDGQKSVTIEVENAYLDALTQQEVIGTFRDQVAYARDNYLAVSKQFEFGLATMVDVMDANAIFVIAERQLADATYNYRLSRLRLQQATGTLLATVMSPADDKEEESGPFFKFPPFALGPATTEASP